MSDAEKKGKRRIVGVALAASGLLMLMVALLVYSGSIDVSDEARLLVSSVLGVVAAVDGSLATYFLLSDPS
jgi:hypothetical protein